MQSWPAPPVPRLPSPPRDLALALYDTASRSVRPTAPGPQARMYVCGITPYDATHLGHAATYLAFDHIRRLWLDLGHDVHHVQNVTDVDDPLLERAERDGEDWRELAARQIELFATDMVALRLLPPQDYIGAVEAIPEIVDAVRRLQDAGIAYAVDDDLYFSVDAVPQFGYESSLGVPEMVQLSAENGGDPDRPGKKNPLDPLLWRAQRPGEPSWDTPLGPGRPGWHIECTAIALNRLGIGFDVQGGGRDLIFPHHEMSAAHGEALTGKRPFAEHYVHTGLMALGGEKMSKSLGNLVFVHRLRSDGVEPAAIRLALSANHYRTDCDWTDEQITSAQRRLELWRAGAAAAAGPDGAALLDAVRRRLANDLDTPGALSTVDDWAVRANRGEGDDKDAPALARTMVDALLGIEL